MQKGRTGTGFNPADITRGIQKGGNAPRAMAQPVGPAKGVARTNAKPKAGLGGLARKLNRTGNARGGGAYREVAGISKAGVKGTYHVYPGDRRVFVPSEADDRKAASARRDVRKREASFASRAKRKKPFRGAGVG
jgi:hypothetical protein